MRENTAAGGASISPIAIAVGLKRSRAVQILLVLVGHVYSLWVAGRTSGYALGSRKRPY